VDATALLESRPIRAYPYKPPFSSVSYYKADLSLLSPTIEE
jgi:hypothetical protein